MLLGSVVRDVIQYFSSLDLVVNGRDEEFVE